MEAYIVGGYRSAIGKAPRGVFRFTRPDDIAEKVIRRLLQDFPQLDKERIDDVVVGNAFPEAEQGFNMGRMLSLMSLDTDKVGGSTVNRYCASGLEAVAIATAKIKAGMADIIIAGGAETMSMVSMGGWRGVTNYNVSKNNVSWYHSMGLTAEAVAREYNINREDQDLFALESHNRALKAIKSGFFKEQIVPVNVEEVYLDENGKRAVKSFIVDTDEGPRPSNIEGLNKLKAVFSADGSVTAGNASQMSDGAAFLLVVSEKIVKELNLTPIARLVDYQVAGVPPYKMGIGPLEAIPKVLKHAGMNVSQIDVFELNEAFASQSLAVVRGLGLDTAKVNPNGGAIALGHPLGCTGAKLSVQVMNELKRTNGKYGMVTMCVGTGQGAAGIYEML
jgi:acetyl-CoA acyltransferase